MYRYETLSFHEKILEVCRKHEHFFGFFCMMGHLLQKKKHIPERMKIKLETRVTDPH
jgi:hypothetical protein